MKKAILLIHGLGGTSNDFNLLKEDLHKYYDVFSFTLPGHDNKRVINVAKEDWLNKSEGELQKIIDKGYKEIYVLGHSMGGVIASYLASKYKEITKLILASPAYKYQNKKEFSIKEGFRLLKYYSIKKIISNLKRVPKRTFNEFLNLVIEHQEDIKKIKCPVLILWGKLDNIVSENTINYIYNNIGSNSVTLTKINNIPHSIFINNKYKVIKEIILNFLNNENKSIKKETSI